MRWIVMLTLFCLVLIIGLATCAKNDSDDDDNDNDDNDTSSKPADGTEKPNCGGYDLPECGTADDVPPTIVNLLILVNGESEKPPVTVQSGDSLKFSIDFWFGDNCDLKWGHFFISSADGFTCMETPDLDYYIPCETGEDPPEIFEVDPMIFKNREDAPYYLMLSNACRTFSNKIPLDIITVVE